MRSRLFMALTVIVASACATGGQGDGNGDEAGRMTMVVANEYTSVVTAYVIWNGTRTRLGEVSPRQTRTFSTPRRGDQVGFGVEVFATPSPGTGAGPSVMSGGSTPGIRPPIAQFEAIPVSPSEGIEWKLTSSGSLLFRRLPD